MDGLRFAISSAALLVATGCVHAGPDGPRGMRPLEVHVHDRDPRLLELARVEPKEIEQVLLVVFPRSGCSASASAVIVDVRGHFFGAVAPGSAALLNVPKDARELTVISSVDVTAPVGTWHDAKRTEVPSPPSGLLIESSRFSARECATEQYVDVTVATKAMLEDELAESDVRWLALDSGKGQAWLDAHRSRVAEVLSKPPIGAPPEDLTALTPR